MNEPRSVPCPHDEHGQSTQHDHCGTDHSETIPPDCRALIEQASQLVDADEDTWNAEILAHLDECPPCRVFLDQLIDLRAILHGLHDSTAPPLTRFLGPMADPS